MRYFDPNEQADLDLLHPAGVRQHDELEAVAKQAEADVVGKSRFGAHEGEEEATGEAAEALRRTIADVTAHRLRYYDTDDTVTSEKRGQRSTQRAAKQLDADWPKRWAWRLRRLPRPATYTA